MHTMSKRPSSGKDTGVETIKEELVRFDNVKSSYFTEAPRVTLTYTLSPNTPFTPHDWIGLFPLNYPDTSDPLAFTSAALKVKPKKKKKRGSNNEDRRQVEFPIKDASINIVTDSKSRRYQFVYVSKSGQVYGESRTFSIQGEELWSLADDDEEYSRLSTRHSSATTLLYDSEISILSRSPATSTACPSESPVLLSYPSSDMESDAGDAKDDWDMTNLGSGSEDGNNTPQQQGGTVKNGGGGGGGNVSETALSEEFSDIEVLSTSPSKDDNSGGGLLLPKGSRQCSSSSSMRSSSNDEMVSSPDKVYPEDDFTLCDIKIQNNQFCVLGDNTGETDGLIDDNNEEEKRKDDERAATKKSKKRKREKRKAESMDEMSSVDDVNDWDTLEDKSLKSEGSSGSSKKSKKEKKRMELEKSKTEETIDGGSTSGSCSSSEKLPKELSDKSKRKRSKCEPNEEEVCSINEGLDQMEDRSDCSSVKKSKSKKSRKEKQSEEKEPAEAVVVNVERMFSPPLSQHLQQTFLKTVTDQFRFLEVEDDVLSIRLSDVEGDEKESDDNDDDGEEEERNRVSSSVMSKKEKRKMRKMKERMGDDEKSSSNKKPMIVELSTVVEKEEEKKKTKKNKKKNDKVVNNVEAQTEDHVTDRTQKPSEVNTDEETAREKRSKKKMSERVESDPEPTTTIHTSRGKDASSDAAAAKTIDNHDKSTLPVTSPVSDKKITARRNDKSMTESKINATSPPLLKGKHGGKKVPKDNNKGTMSVYFETVAAVAAPASTMIITEQETSPTSIINITESQKGGKNDRRPTKDASCEKSQHSKVTKKSKRQCKDEKIESADGEVCTKHNDDAEAIVMTTATREICDDRSGETENYVAFSGQSGKRSKKSRRSLSDNQEGEGMAATATNTPTASDASSDKREHSDADDSTKGLKKNKKSKSLDNDEKQQRIVEKSKKTSESEDTAIMSKDKTRKIPKTVPAANHVVVNDTNTPDTGDDECIVTSSKKKPKAKNRVQESVVEKHEVVTDADILNNNIGDASVRTKYEDKQQGEGKKKRRKNEVESAQSVTNDSVNIQEAKNSSKDESNFKKEEKTSKSKKSSKSSAPEMDDKQQTVNLLKECSSSAKTDENQESSQAEDVMETLELFQLKEAPEGTKKEKKNKKLKTAQAKIENQDEDICSEISLEKHSIRDSLSSNSEKPNTEPRSGDKKTLKKLKKARSEECWEEKGEGSDKENSRTSVRNKMYLTKKEKMKAALKVRMGKKERRGKSKSDKVIRLKELFDESFASCSDWEDDAATTTNVNKPTTSTPARGTTSKQPRRMIPAYLLDVMDDLPQNPDTPNFHQWRKSMAHGCAGKNKGKMMTRALKDEKTDTETQESKNLKKASLILDMSVDVAAAKERKTQENLAKTGNLPPSPPVANIEKLVDNSSDDNDDDKNVDDRKTEERSLRETTPIDVSLMSYADVLKGISTCMRMALCTNNLIPSKSLIQIAKRRMHGNAKSLHPPFDRKALIRNRRDIFSWGLENLTTASLETQCYLLDKVEDRLMGRHPQFSRRTKIRAARKIRTEKQRHKKLMQKRGQNRTQKQALNGEMVSTESIPMCTSLAWESVKLKKRKKRSVNLISNKNDSDDDDDDDDEDDSISSVTWPLPRDLTTVAAPSSFHKNVRSKEEATVSAIIEIGDSWPPSSWMDLDKVNDDDNDGNNIVIIEDLMSTAHASSADTWPEEKTTPNGDDECLGVVEEPSFTFASRVDHGIDEYEDEEDDYDFVRKIERCRTASNKRDARSNLEDVTACSRRSKSSTPPKREGVRIPGLPKSLGLAHAMLERLRSEGKVKDREIATLEGEVHCLKEVIKAHTKQEFKTRIKLFAVKRKYNSLKAARIGQRVTVLEPEMPRSNDDVSQGNESDNEESLSATQPLSKKRKLEESPQWGQQATIRLEATTKPEEEIFPLDLKKKRITSKSLAESESINIYPDIQNELKELQHEVDKYSYGPNLQDQHTSQKHEKQLEFSRQQPSFPIPSSASFVPASIAEGWERECHLRCPEDAFNFHPKQSSQEHQSLPGPYFRHPEVSQQHNQRCQQQQQQHFVKNCLFTTEPRHDQQTPTSAIFPSMPPYPTSSSKNLPGPIQIQNQYSPPKPALLPTPTKAPQTPTLSDTKTPPSTAVNPNLIPPTNSQPPSPNTLRTSRGYSCPPYQRSRSSTVVHQQTSPTWRRHPSQSSAQRPNNAFGNTRYSPMTRPPPHPATVVVAPRPRYFNRPFLCNTCSSQVPYPSNGCNSRQPPVATGSLHGRCLVEPYSDYRPGLYPISDGYKPPTLENFPAWNQPIYLGHEQHFNARLPPPLPPPSPPCCYFTLPEDHQSVTGSTSSYFSNYPHLDSSCSLPRQDCNCCPNNYNLPYTP